MITKHYFIVEGESDSKILSTILDRRITEASKIIVSNGGGTIISKTRSLALLTDLPISVVFDTDTTNEIIVKEKKNYFHSILNQFTTLTTIKLHPAVPELEIIFFESKSVLEKLLDRKVSNEIFNLSKVNPKKALEKHISLTALLAKLSSNEHLRRELIENSELLRNIDYDLSYLKKL